MSKAKKKSKSKASKSKLKAGNKAAVETQTEDINTSSVESEESNELTQTPVAKIAIDSDETIESAEENTELAVSLDEDSEELLPVITDMALKYIVESLLLAAKTPLTVKQIKQYVWALHVKKEDIQTAIEELKSEWESRGLCLYEVATGYQFRVKSELAPILHKLWDEKPPKYTRALLETLAIIAYKQPVTRAEIEDIRGVAVSTNIIRTLEERLWIKVVGHRDLPGKPGVYATTDEFLDYFSLSSINELPELSDIKDIEAQAENLEAQLPLALEAQEDEVANDDSSTLEAQEISTEEEAISDGAEIGGETEAETESEAIEHSDNQMIDEFQLDEGEPPAEIETIDTDTESLMTDFETMGEATANEVDEIFAENALEEV